MGNQASRAGPVPHLEDLVGDLKPDIMYKDSLGGGRLFKTSLCLHDEGGLVTLKTYARRQGFQDVQHYEDALIQIRTALAPIPSPHVWPTQRLYQSDRAVHLVRQYLWSSLSQRITSRPFLSLAEKRWFGYQLLEGLVQAHAAGVCHGDIKSENVLLTSWGWVFLVDFAPYKPVTLPSDNTADFSTFFHTGGPVRKCYLAPERFYDSGQTGVESNEVLRPSNLDPSMDVFAAGCVLAELFADGEPLFNYSQLLAFRQGDFDPGPGIAALGKGIREVVACMTSREPSARPSAAQCLKMFAEQAWDPVAPHLLLTFAAEIMNLDPDKRAARVAAKYADLAHALEGNSVTGNAHELVDAQSVRVDANAAEEGVAPSTGPSMASPEEDACSTTGGGCVGTPSSITTSPCGAMHSEALELLAEAKAAVASLRSLSNIPTSPKDRAVATNSSAHDDISPGARVPTLVPLQRDHSQTLGNPPIQQQQHVQPGVIHEGLILLLSLLCSVLRGCRHQRVRVRLVHCICDCALRCGDDEARLQRAVPQLVTAAAEVGQFPAVRCAALISLTRIFRCVRVIPPAEARAFADYVLPSLSLLPTDGEAAVQECYARALGPFASQARIALEMEQMKSKATAGQQRQHQQRDLATVGQQQQQRDLGNDGGGSSSSGSSDVPPVSRELGPSGVKFDEEMARLRQALERAVHELLVGSKSHPKLAILPQLYDLSSVLGRRDTADSLLPTLVTLFNAREWQVRKALYYHLQGMGPALGQEGIMYLLPLLDGMLADCEPSAVASALRLLAALCSVNLLSQSNVLAATTKICDLGLLRSHSTSVRAAVVEFLAAAASAMSQVAAMAMLFPLIKHHLTKEPWLLGTTPADIVECLEPRRFGSSAGASTSTQGAPSTEPTATVEAVGAPTTTYYSIPLDPQCLRRCTSYLECALKQRAVVAATSGPRMVVADLTTTDGVSGESDTGGEEGMWGSSAACLVARAQRRVMVRPVVPNPPETLKPPNPNSDFVRPDEERRMQGRTSIPLSDQRAHHQGVLQDPQESTGLGRDAPWRPRGVLMAHLADHKGSISRLAAITGTNLFVTASEDGTAKVWDCRRFELDKSFLPRASYDGHGGTALCAASALSDRSSIATADSHGAVHVWRIERAGAGRPDTAWHAEEGPQPSGTVTDLHAWGVDIIALSTRNSGVLGLDARSSPWTQAWRLQHHSALGAVCRFCCDPIGASWIVSGTTRGAMALWDLRFLVPVCQWRHPTGARIDALAVCEAEKMGIKGVPGMVAFAAAGRNEVAAWDVASGVCRKVMRGSLSLPHSASRSPTGGPGGGVPDALAAPPPFLGGAADPLGRARQLATSELRSLAARPPGIRAVLNARGGGLLTAGSDCAVRYWDVARPERSYMVVVPPPPLSIRSSPDDDESAPGDASKGAQQPNVEATVPSYTYGVGMINGVDVVGEQCALSSVTTGEADAGRQQEARQIASRWRNRAAGLAHQQTVVDIACVEGCVEPLLTTASMDGVVKVWR